MTVIRFLITLLIAVSLIDIGQSDKPEQVRGRTYGLGAFEAISSLFTDAGVRPKPIPYNPSNKPSSNYGDRLQPPHVSDNPKNHESINYNSNQPLIEESHDNSKPNQPNPSTSNNNEPSYDGALLPVDNSGLNEKPPLDPSHEREPVKPVDPLPPSSVYSNPSYSEDSDEDDQDSHGCICVPYYQCNNGRIVEDGAGIIDPRLKDSPKKEIPFDEHYKPPFCGTIHVCCSQPETATQLPYIHKCGTRKPNGINRRVLSPETKGEADFGEWPWQVAILKDEKGVSLFQCGATLIDDQHIVTVAHCVKNFVNQQEYSLKARLGEWDTQKTTEFLPHEDYEVKQVILHPKFNPTNYWNDIAILKLAKKVNFKPNIDSVCLPTPDELFDGQTCITTGWGTNAYKDGQYSNILKEVSLPIVPHYQCQKALRKTRLGSRFRLHDSFICAGGEQGKDSCKGDGGGPLVCYRQDGSYVLVGIVAWGIDCGQQGQPGVYVKVQKFLDWINQVTESQVKDYSKPVNVSPPSHHGSPVETVNHGPSSGY